jgi:hypothetical protein
MLRIFTLVKIQRLRPGLNPRTREPEASMLTTRPKPSRSACNFTLGYTPDKMLGRPEGLLVHSGEEKKLCHSWKMNSGLLARCSVTIVTEIFPFVLELLQFVFTIRWTAATAHFVKFASSTTCPGILRHSCFWAK